MAELQAQISALDAQKSKLVAGEAEHNMHIPGVGYYHAEAHDFFEHPYGYQQDNRWYANGVWQDSPPPASALLTSRPSVEALKKLEKALDEEQQQLANAKAASNGGTARHHHSGFGTGLMMYWLLAGNRGSYAPGAGFRAAGAQVGSWQEGVDNQRRTVSAYAASNPGYQRAVEQSRARGVPVRAGQSVRGGFGSSSRSSAS